MPGKRRAVVDEEGEASEDYGVNRNSHWMIYICKPLKIKQSM